MQSYILFLRKRKYDETGCSLEGASSTVVAATSTVEGVVVLPSDEEDEASADGAKGEGSGCSHDVGSTQLATSTTIKTETVETEGATLFKGISIDNIIELSDDEMSNI